jgi:hypothetical protein
MENFGGPQSDPNKIQLFDNMSLNIEIVIIKILKLLILIFNSINKLLPP